MWEEAAGWQEAGSGELDYTRKKRVIALDDDDDDDGSGGVAGAAAATATAPLSSSAGTADPGDELAELLAARERQAAEDAAMRVQVHAEMAARMDSGVRVNPALAKAFGVRGGQAASSHGADEPSADDHEGALELLDW